MNDQEIWHVKLDGGASRSGTLDQLDEAFQAGLIDENTLVRREGSGDWMTLAQAAGLDEVPAPISSVAPPTVVSSIAPAALDLDDVDFKPRSKSRSLLIGAGAAILFGALGFVALRSSPSVTASAAGVTPPAVVANVNAVAPAFDNDGTPVRLTLTDEQKRALAEADKKREAEMQKRRAQQMKNAPAPPSRGIRQGNPFHKGGDKNDPLNASL